MENENIIIELPEIEKAFQVKNDPDTIVFLQMPFIASHEQLDCLGNHLKMIRKENGIKVKFVVLNGVEIVKDPNNG